MNTETISLLKKRKASLFQERSAFDSRAKACAQFCLPRAGRFQVTDHNKGMDARYSRIYDNTAIRANRTLAAGLMAGMTSPARPWFRLQTPDPGLMEYDPVKLWLSNVTKLMQMVFAKSGAYRTLHTMYEELGCFGTAAAFIQPDFNNIIHTIPMTFGEYALGVNHKGEVDTLVREFEMQVGAIVRQFGIKNVSDHVRTAYNNGNLEVWFPITHYVGPRDTCGCDKATKKPFVSIYYESACDAKCLSVSGFNLFPYLTPRWSVTGGDTYGDSPASECLGMTKGLQQQTLRKGQAIDYQTNPPLQMPAGYKSMQVNTLPGGVSYVDMSTSGKIQPIFDTNINLRDLGLDIQDVRKQIDSTFYVDLFMMIAHDQRSGTTAKEIMEMAGEKMLQLGPVLERLNSELIEPLIDITFDQVTSATLSGGRPLVPPPPPELRDMELQVDFISSLMSAQKSTDLQIVERFTMFTGNLAQVRPEALDKINVDKVIDIYADLSGVDPLAVTPDDEVIAIRQNRAAQQQQQMMAQQMASMAQPAAQAANAAKTLSETDVGKDQTMLKNLIEGLGG